MSSQQSSLSPAFSAGGERYSRTSPIITYANLIGVSAFVVYMFLV